MVKKNEKLEVILTLDTKNEYIKEALRENVIEGKVKITSFLIKLKEKTLENINNKELKEFISYSQSKIKEEEKRIIQIVQEQPNIVVTTKTETIYADLNLFISSSIPNIHEIAMEKNQEEWAKILEKIEYLTPKDIKKDLKGIEELNDKHKKEIVMLKKIIRNVENKVKEYWLTTQQLFESINSLTTTIEENPFYINQLILSGNRENKEILKNIEIIINQTYTILNNIKERGEKHIRLIEEAPIFYIYLYYKLKELFPSLFYYQTTEQPNGLIYPNEYELNILNKYVQLKKEHIEKNSDHHLIIITSKNIKNFIVTYKELINEKYLIDEEQLNA